MTDVEKIIALCKRRGFVYATSDIYGGIGGFYDFGPLGTALSRNIKDLWWKRMVQEREDVVGLDSSIILNPKVWEASGHVSSFTDPLTECKLCHSRLRSDQPDEIAAHENLHQKEGQKPEWTEAKKFNLLFRTYVGPVQDETSQAYLRGETCQGIFTNFPNVLASTRVKVPFGIAQIGKVFRNEVTPGKFLFRMREFEQMELEYFVHPHDAVKSLEFWKKDRFDWFLSLGINPAKLRFRQHEKNERAHYAADSWDIEYDFPDWGYKELEGIANRTDYDLKTHAKYSGIDLSYTDPFTNERYLPYVIEPSVGVSRLFLALIFDSYREEEKRVVLSLSPALAPNTVAVFPLVANKPGLVGTAKKIREYLKPDFRVAWDERGNIGKRYLSQDEAGTPWCVTVDYQTLEDQSVTVRERDTTKQERVNIAKLADYFRSRLKGGPV
jgi:glycyl-tRNA synthetase